MTKTRHRDKRSGKRPKASHNRSDLQEELAEAVRQRTAMSQVLRAIASSPHDLQPIFDTILDSARKLSRADTGVFRLAEEAGFRLVARALSPGVPETVLPPTLVVRGTFQYGFYDRLTVSKSPLHIPDVALELDHAAEAVALIQQRWLRTLLFVPMLRKHELIGALTLGRLRVEHFTEKEIELVTDFAAQATIALDIVRRERQLRELQIELSRANRIETMGQLSSSIAHEVNQPIAGILANSEAALIWLSHGPAKLADARRSIEHVISDGNRAAEIIGRIRDLIKKAPPKKDRFDINEAIRDVIILTRGEAIKNGASVQTQFADGLPFVEGDRVEVQQVILNLIINAIQAMSGVDATRNLLVSTVNLALEGTLVAVSDSGSGLSGDHFDRLFEPFYTTKPEGLGMGLAICRSIVDAHGGRLWASANEPRGAIFQFTLPHYRIS